MYISHNILVFRKFYIVWEKAKYIEHYVKINESTSADQNLYSCDSLRDYFVNHHSLGLPI